MRFSKLLRALEVSERQESLGQACQGCCRDPNYLDLGLPNLQAAVAGTVKSLQTIDLRYRTDSGEQLLLDGCETKFHDSDEWKTYVKSVVANVDLHWRILSLDHIPRPHLSVSIAFTQLTQMA